MTTKEIDDLFLRLQGVEQFVIGNIALDRHKRFFLNLDDSEKLAILKERGHTYPPVAGSLEKVPVKGVKIKSGCPSSYGKDMSVPDNLAWCHRMQDQTCKGCRYHIGEVTKVVKEQKASAPVQMGLF